MATRLYLSSTAASDVNPAYEAGLGTTNADRRKMSTTKDASAMTSKAVTGLDVVHRQYVSEPLASAVTFNSGVTVKIQQRAQTNTTSAQLVHYVKVVSGDGATVRGYMVNAEFGANLATTLKNTSFTLACGTVNAQAGDRIVWMTAQTGSASKTVTISYGADNATDLPIDTTTTAANNPWIEFSNNFTFSGGSTPTNHNSLSCMGCG